MLLLTLSLLASDDPASLEAFQDGQAGERCLSMNDCAAPLECREKKCVPPGTYTSCRRTPDCPGDLRCVSKQCVMPGMEPIEPPSRAAQPVAPPPPYFVPRSLTLPYEEGTPVPLGWHVEERSKKGMWIAGLTVFGASWLVSGLLGTFGLGTPLTWIPVFGNVTRQMV